MLVLLAHVPRVELVAAELDAPLIDTETDCPFCGHDSTLRLLEDGRFYCFGCGANGRAEPA